MSTPFLGEIKIFACDYAPKSWAQCNGQQLPINQNQALFALLGTTYGGNGQTTFALPDLRARVPMHMGNGHIQGEAAGENEHTITQSETPMHTHTWAALSSDGNQANPLNQTYAKAKGNLFAAPANLVPMNPQAALPVGGGQPHENRQPYLVLTLCIALQGIFPSKN